MNMQLEGLSKSSKISDPDHSKSVISDENREYTPAEVLDWETQIYSEEDLAKLENDQVLDENEEKKSKSTLDSTEKSGGRWMWRNKFIIIKIESFSYSCNFS